MNGINKQFSSISQVTGQYLNPKQNGRVVNNADGTTSFQEILQQTQESHESSELKFSKHASLRLSDRSIELTDSQMHRLEDGTIKAEQKGINESLVIVDKLAFIVNVPNKTVITAMDQNEANDNVFTNIDGAVII